MKHLADINTKICKNERIGIWSGAEKILFYNRSEWILDNPENSELTFRRIVKTKKMRNMIKFIEPTKDWSVSQAQLYWLQRIKNHWWSSRWFSQESKNCTKLERIWYNRDFSSWRKDKKIVSYFPNSYDKWNTFEFTYKMSGSSAKCTMLMAQVTWTWTQKMESQRDASLTQYE